MSTLTLWDSSASSSPGWWPPATPFWVVGQGTEGWAGRSSPLGDGNQHFCQQGCAETKNLRLAPRSQALDDSLPPPGARHRPRAQLLVPFGTFSLTGMELGEGRASPVWDVAASSPSLLPHPAPASLAVQAGTMRVVPENWKHKKNANLEQKCSPPPKKKRKALSRDKDWGSKPCWPDPRAV